jgi:FtsZ-interacting cell division protein ZipA
LINNCDEFIYYEDLERPVGTPPKIEQDLPEQKKEAFQLLVDSVVALIRENKEVLWASMVKETMKRKKPSFNESYHGYRTFSDLLQDAEDKGIIRLRTDSRSGTYVIVGFGKEKKKGEQEGLKEVKETKEHKEIKERKPVKPRWRSRSKRPKTQPSTTATTPAAPESGTSEPAAPEVASQVSELSPSKPASPGPGASESALQENSSSETEPAT